MADEIKKPVRFQPSFRANDNTLAITIPWPAAGEQGAIANHIERISWFAKNFGGTLNVDHTEWLFEFEHEEEYISVIRYLSNPKFNIQVERFGG